MFSIEWGGGIGFYKNQEEERNFSIFPESLGPKGSVWCGFQVDAPSQAILEPRRFRWTLIPGSTLEKIVSRILKWSCKAWYCLEENSINLFIFCLLCNHDHWVVASRSWLSSSITFMGFWSQEYKPGIDQSTFKRAPCFFPGPTLAANFPACRKLVLGTTCFLLFFFRFFSPHSFNQRTIFFTSFSHHTSSQFSKAQRFAIFKYAPETKIKD